MTDSSDEATAPASAKGSAPETLVDDELHAAEGIRKTSQWIASALGAIPGLAIVTSVVRSPGDSGFEPIPLALGIALAAVGAMVGIRAFSEVMRPAGLTEGDLLAHFDMSRLSGQPFASYKDLALSIQRIASAAAMADLEANDAEVAARSAEAVAASADAAAIQAETASEQQPGDKKLKAAASRARRLAMKKAAEAVSRNRDSAAATAAVTEWPKQLKARQGLRVDAYRLKTADVVRERFDNAWRLDSTVVGNAWIAAGLFAAGVILLALAPRPKALDTVAATAPTFVTLTLSDAGKAVLDCPRDQVSGLRIGGSDEAPLVVVLPPAPCQPNLVEFKTSEKVPLGSVASAAPIGAPELTPSPTATPTPVPR